MRIIETCPKCGHDLVDLVPRCIWNRKRQKELADAMLRYLEAGKSIPREWVDEYNELSEEE